jgi:hypothetical protein
MSIEKRIKIHETHKRSEFLEKHIYGKELKEFMGTDLKELIVNHEGTEKRFDLLGIEVIDRSILFYVKYYFEGAIYNMINQQFLSCIERSFIINKNIHLYIS